MPKLDGTEHVLSIDSAFTAEERSEIEEGAALWREATAGRMNVRVTAEPGGEATMRRGPTGGDRFGRITWASRSISIDADALAAYPHGVRAMTANMLGQIVGMPLHDGCGVLGRDCLKPKFTPADRDVCVGFGACEP